MKNIIILLLWISSLSLLHAQTVTMPTGVPAINKKWGKPTMDEMTMKDYPLDKEAEAVVLMQTCDVKYEMATMYDLTITYDYKIRIKILKEEGKKFGDFSIPFYSKEEGASIDEEEFNTFTATSYNLNEKGKIESTKLSPQHIRDERVNSNTKIRKFSVPQVREGSIIEVHYLRTSQRFYHIYDYCMQMEIPIIYERYFMEIPAVLQFNVEAPVKMKNVKTNVSYSYVLIEGSDPKRPQRCNANCYDIEAYLMPAIRNVNYVWNEADYAAKVVCDLKSAQFPGTAKREYGMTWEQADRLILSHDQIGPKLNDKSKFKDELATSGIASIADKNERIGAAVLFLASHVAWDGTYSNIPELASTIAKKRSGSSADVNLMLINVLNDLGFKSYPVYLSTRRHGRLPIHPSADAFNTFIVAVETNNGICYVDGTDPHGASNVLNPNLYVTNARMIGSKTKGSWVDLTKYANHRTNYQTTFSLSLDGKIDAEMMARYTKDSARELKNRYHNAKDSLSYVQSLQQDYGITINSIEMTGHNQYGDEVNSTVKYSKTVETSDDHIYVTPFVFNPMGESPFKDENRDLPIELPYPMSVNYIVKMNIPDGYMVEELPKDYQVTVPDRSMTIKMSCTSTDDQVRISFTYTCKSMFYAAEAYAAVKKVYDMAYQSMNDIVVLKKK